MFADAGPGPGPLLLTGMAGHVNFGATVTLHELKALLSVSEVASKPFPQEFGIRESLLRH